MYVLIEDKAFKLVTEKTRVKALLNAYKELKLNVIRKCITVMSRPIQVTESSSCQCVLGGDSKYLCYFWEGIAPTMYILGSIQNY